MTIMTGAKSLSKVLFRSIGCRTNQEEFTELAEVLTSRGHRIVEHLEEAEIIMVNTCSVTGATESKTRRMLTALAADAPQARILVTGCLAQQNPEHLKTMANVCWVVGNQLKKDIADILEHEPQGIYHTSLADAPATLALPQRTVLSPLQNTGRTRFPIKIQEGCNFRCSYCIVPSLRGSSRSSATTQVLDLFKQAVSSGYKEVILTGTHIGQFSGSERDRLTGLVEKMIRCDGDFRIRLSSLDPRDCSAALLSLIGNEPKVCRHLHVSLQSASNKILAVMERPVDASADLLGRLLQFRKDFPDVGIGADIIVGFPGEEPEDFNDTAKAVGDIGLSYIHAFKFSRRPGTPAATMAHQVAESVKTQRSLHLREIVAASRRRFIAETALKPARIITESVSPVRGLTSNYLHVELENTSVNHNEWLDVYVTEKVRGRYCLAKPVNDKVA